MVCHIIVHQQIPSHNFYLSNVTVIQLIKKSRLVLIRLRGGQTWRQRLSGSCEGGSCYYDCKPFSARELRKHFGLYLFNQLAPSHRVKQKFKTQSQDPVHGNDFIYHKFGTNAKRRHLHFKNFLEIQDPAISTPSRKKYPNWNVRPLVQWINYSSPLIWLLGACFAIDKMKIGFQDMHADKKRITYKSKGCGFHEDTLCEDGFCFQFYFRNDPENVE